MSATWAAVIAAFGASALTGLASLGVMWWQQHLRQKSAAQAAIDAAVTEMLSRSMAVSLRADAVGQMIKIRSGLMEGVDIVLTRVRKPLDMFEFYDWMAQDMAPMNAAWSAIWAHGDQELVMRANALLAACTELLSASTAGMPAETLLAKAKRTVAGERWTPEMLEEMHKALTTLAAAREQLAQYARTVRRLPAARLFGPEPAAAADGHQPPSQ